MFRVIASKLMKLGITATGRTMLSTLDKKSLDVKAAQLDVLKDILRYANQTVYGVEHDFGSIGSVEAFQQKVPINTYEDLRPYVSRHADGEPNVLFPGKPLFYATTSGTTDRPKLIPISKKYHDECYNGLTKLWLYSMFRELPDFMDGRDLSMVGKAVEGRTADGTTYGSFSGHMNAYMPAFIKRFRVVPFEVHDIDDYHAKYYTLMRIALEHPIRWIVTANPSTLVELHRVAVAHFEEMVRDIETGTLPKELRISTSIRAVVEKRLRPNPKRAAALRALARNCQLLLPKHYWPSLQIINTWKSGNSGLYLKQTEDYYAPSTVIREFGYLATEARAGIVLDGDAETSVLAAHLLFFEFIKTEDYDTPNPRAYLAHEIEDGREYYILITTPSGLYRYDMNDIVRVEGFYNQFPQIRFIQKGRGVVSLTGEKLSEAQYLSAVERLEVELRLQLSFHVAFADQKSSRYHIFMEATEGNAPLNPETVSQALDAALSRLNMEYDAKRKSNRLKSPVIHPLAPGSFFSYKQQALEAGARDGQFKLTRLSIDNERFEIFKTLAINAPH